MAATKQLAAIVAGGREAKLYGYLEQVAAEGLISRRLSTSAWEAWKTLADAMPDVPNACPGPDGSLLFTWDRGEHHLELEFYPDELPSFFYANRDTSALWEAEYDAGQPLNSEIRAKLALFIADE